MPRTREVAIFVLTDKQTNRRMDKTDRFTPLAHARGVTTVVPIINHNSLSSHRDGRPGAVEQLSPSNWQSSAAPTCEAPSVWQFGCRLSVDEYWQALSPPESWHYSPEK